MLMGVVNSSDHVCFTLRPTLRQGYCSTGCLYRAKGRRAIHTERQCAGAEEDCCSGGQDGTWSRTVRRRAKQEDEENKTCACYCRRMQTSTCVLLFSPVWPDMQELTANNLDTNRGSSRPQCPSSSPSTSSTRSRPPSSSCRPSSTSSPSTSCHSVSEPCVRVCSSASYRFNGQRAWKGSVEDGSEMWESLGRSPMSVMCK